MTMLDDEALSALMHELGDSYPIPPSGVADTLRRVRESGSGNESGNEAKQDDHAPTAVGEGGVGEEVAAGSVRRMLRTHLWLSVAASLIVLLALAGGALLLGASSNAPKTAALKALPPTATRHAPSQKSSAGAGTSFSAAAPSATPATAGGATAGGTTAGGATATGAPSLPVGSVGQPARIEQTGSLDLTVARGALTSTMNKLTSLASAYGGFVANSQTQSGGSSTGGSSTGGSSSGGSSSGAASGTVTLQVPVANFSALLAAAKSLGQTSALTTKATDVTSQYVDLQSQITALEASRQQYLTIMTKASSVGDVLAVQAQLDTIQSQIQQLQGQLNVLQSETDYSTLTVGLAEATHHHHHATKPAVSGIAKAWNDSLHGFAVGVDGIIRLAGPALFALLCLAALVLGGRLTWRRLQRHNL
jgi:hypothetical protein